MANTNITTPTLQPHILVFPYPAQGHMLPLLDLTHQLLLRRLTITILVTPQNLPILTPLLSAHPPSSPSSLHTLVLPFPTHPSIPTGVENVKDLPIHGFRSMMVALSQLTDPLLHWFRSHSSPPVAILSDIFLGWTHHLATQLRIPRIVFSPSGALALSIMNSLWRLMPSNKNPDDLISFPEIPNSPIFPLRKLSTVYRSYVAGDPDSEFIKDGMLANLASWGLVVNTFGELESTYLTHLKADLGHDRVWAVGPLMPVGQTSPKERGAGSSSVAAEDLMSWLDGCADRSVVYVCFGSQAVLANQQMDALAAGLEQSGARFVWVVKEPTKGHVAGEYGDVPDGFEGRVKGRGLIMKGWAPQVSILSHRAVAAFVTHCGWNSVMESLVAGVAMLTWPMGADQFANAKILEELGVGVRVCEGAGTVPNGDELGRLVAESVSEGSELRRNRARELSRAALSAVGEGGSSVKDLDGLARVLGQLVVTNNNLESEVENNNFCGI